MIHIVPYDARWPDEFARLVAALRQALGDMAVRVDHIGSTAVPGLAAKDIIDIQVTVRDFDPALEAALAALGYARRRDITTDHRPTHLHVRIDGRANQRYALLFRDYLRAHPVAADAYGIVKQQLARQHPDDADAYYDVKDPVCDIIWHAAEAWAHNTSWQPEASP